VRIGTAPIPGFGCVSTAETGFGGNDGCKGSLKCSEVEVWGFGGGEMPRLKVWSYGADKIGNL